MIQLVEISPFPSLFKLLKLKTVLKRFAYHVHHGNTEAILTFTVLGASIETVQVLPASYQPSGKRSSSSLPKSSPMKELLDLRQINMDTLQYISPRLTA